MKNKPNSISKPAGFLFRAVENPEKFVLPSDSRPQRSMPLPLGAVTQKHAAPKPVSTRQKGTYEKLKIAAFEDFKRGIAPDLLSSIQGEVEAGLSKMRHLISEARFQETVTHAVNERLMKLLEFPSFEKWVTNN
jgi:hypothetical protein